MNSEDHNLGIYRILYIIKGIITLAFAILPLLYMFFGAFIFSKGDIPEEDAHIAGFFIIGLGIFIFLLLLIMGILTLLTAKYLGEKETMISSSLWQLLIALREYWELSSEFSRFWNSIKPT